MHTPQYTLPHTYVILHPSLSLTYNHTPHCPSHTTTPLTVPHIQPHPSLSLTYNHTLTVPHIQPHPSLSLTYHHTLTVPHIPPHPHCPSHTTTPSLSLTYNHTPHCPSHTTTPLTVPHIPPHPHCPSHTTTPSLSLTYHHTLTVTTPLISHPILTFMVTYQWDSDDTTTILTGREFLSTSNSSLVR